MRSNFFLEFKGAVETLTIGTVRVRQLIKDLITITIHLRAKRHVAIDYTLVGRRSVARVLEATGSVP